MKTLSSKNIKETIPDILPVIPTMDVVVFPHMIVPLLVLDERIIKGVQQAVEGSKLIMLLASKKQLENQEMAIGMQDLFMVGTVASIMRLVKIPEGGIKVLVQGLHKAKANELLTHNSILSSRIDVIEHEDTSESPEVIAQIKNIKELTERMDCAGQTFSPDFHTILSKMNDPQKIADFILSHLNLTVQDAQMLLEKETLREFLETIYLYLSRELEVAEVQERVKTRARESMNKSQKEFYLREQLKAIKKELGEDDVEDIDSIRAKLATLTIPEEALTEINRQINRLERTAADSMEASVTRNYIDWMLALP